MGQLVSDRLFIQQDAEKRACLWHYLMNSRIWQQSPACNINVNPWLWKRLKFLKAEIPELKNITTIMGQHRQKRQGEETALRKASSKARSDLPGKQNCSESLESLGEISEELLRGPVSLLSPPGLQITSSKPYNFDTSMKIQMSCLHELLESHTHLSLSTLTNSFLAC